MYLLKGTLKSDKSLVVYYQQKRGSVKLTTVKEKAHLYKSHGGAAKSWVTLNNNEAAWPFEWTIEELDLSSSVKDGLRTTVG